MHAADAPALRVSPSAAPEKAISFPVNASVVDVTTLPYNAKGVGVTDDTEALLRAMNEHTGQRHILYFPRGTYLVSATIKWPKK